MWKRELDGLRIECAKYGWRGVVYAIRSRMDTAPRAVRVRHPAAKHPLLLRTHTSDPLVFEEVFVRRAYDLGLAKAPQTIVDCGANIGLTSVFLANQYPEARILALEPEAANYALCVRNCSRYPMIQPLQAAVWGENEQLKVFDPGGHGEWGMRVESADLDPPGPSLGRIQGMTIDLLMETEGIEYIDLLKVDIEGAELEVFRDASAWIDRVGVIVVECHDRFKAGCEASVRGATRSFEWEECVGENLLFARRGRISRPPQSPGGIPA